MTYFNRQSLRAASEDAARQYPADLELATERFRELVSESPDNRWGAKPDPRWSREWVRRAIQKEQSGI